VSCRIDSAVRLTTVGLGFQVFEINDLEVVDLRFSSWNQLVAWLRKIETIKASESFRCQ